MNPDWPQPLVSVEWLLQHINEPELRIVDASWRMPGSGDAYADYLQRHIPNAMFFPIDSIVDRDTDLPHMLPPAIEFERAMQGLGIANRHSVIVYDDRGVFSAPRVWWTFKAMGHGPVAVLDGGLPAWIAAGGAVTDAAPQFSYADYVAVPDVSRIASAADIRQALTDPTKAVLDARPAPRFLGREPEPRPGLACGAMPGARNLPFSELIQANGRLKDLAELDLAFMRRGASAGTPVITTCGSGVTAAILALGLEALGRGPARLYDGSWAEWGRLENDRTKFPVRAGGD
jgi:thiosulfate/3-mercaptopyruvate sulfurtransferase